MLLIEVGLMIMRTVMGLVLVMKIKDLEGKGLFVCVRDELVTYPIYWFSL